MQFPSNVSELISSVGQSIMSFEQVNKQRKKTSMSVLDQLKAVTTIVADTGDFEGKGRGKSVTSIIKVSPAFLRYR